MREMVKINPNHRIGRILNGSIFLSVMVLVQPSISIAGLGIKVIAMGVLVIVNIFGLLYLRFRTWNKIVPYLLRMTLLVLFLSISASIALFHGYRSDSIAEQYEIILNGLIVYTAIKFSTQLQIAQKKDIFFAVVLGTIVFYVVKVGLIALLISGRIDKLELVTQLQSWLGTDLNWVMPSDGVYRIQLPNEIVSIFALGLVLFSSREIFKKKWQYISALIIILVGVISTMSRTFILLAALLIVFKVLKSMSHKRNRIKTICISFIMGLLFVPFGGNLLGPWFSRMVSKGDDGISEGIVIRSQQYHALLYEIKNHPFFGQGIGSYSRQLIRLEIHPWMYETQFTAFIMQIGLFGVIILSLLILHKEVRAILNGHYRIAWLFLGLGWLVASDTNPYLFSSLAGIILWLIKQNITTQPSKPHNIKTQP